MLTDSGTHPVPPGAVAGHPLSLVSRIPAVTPQSPTTTTVATSGTLPPVSHMLGEARDQNEAPSFLHSFPAHPLTPPSPGAEETGTPQAPVRGRRMGRPELPGGAKALGCTLPSHQAEAGDWPG